MVYLEEPIALGPFSVDLGTARLRRDGVDLELRPQAFRALKVLVQNRGRLVDFDQMIREAWGGVRVSRHTVAVTVSELKHVLHEYGSWITCRSKFGYCLEIPESEELLRMGRHFRNQFTRSGFDNGLRCFQQVAQRDAANFRALEAISSTYLMFGAFLTRDPRSLYRDFLAAHQRAVALRGLTAELRIDRAFGFFIFERDILRAESELVEVQRERPRSAEILARLGMVYAGLGRLDDAIALTAQSRLADEILPPLAFVETKLRIFRREFDLAVACGKKCLDLHPGSQFGRLHYAEALEHAGRNEEALTQYRLAAAISPDVPWVIADQARFLALTGRTQEALETLQALKAKRSFEHVDSYYLALLLDALGRRDEAFDELERAFEEHSYMLLLLDVDLKVDALRRDTRFTPLRNRVFEGALTRSR